MSNVVPADPREHDTPSWRLQQIRTQLVRAMSGQDGTFDYLPEIVAPPGSRGGIQLRLPIGGDGHLEVEEPYRRADLHGDNSNLQIENLVAQSISPSRTRDGFRSRSRKRVP